MEQVVIVAIERVQEEEDLREALAEAKKDPAIAAGLAKDLALATTDVEVATAIVNAQTAVSLKSASQSYTQLQVTDRARIAVVKVKNDIVVKKTEEDGARALEEAVDAAAVDAAVGIIEQDTLALK